MSTYFEQGDFYTRHFQPGPTEDTLILNMGPQHPSHAWGFARHCGAGWRIHQKGRACTGIHPSHA